MAGGHHLHLISDSTGETLHALARAALAPFGDELGVTLHLSVFVRTARDLDAALNAVKAEPGLVWFTVVDPAIRDRIEAECHAIGVSSTGVLAPLIDKLATFTGQYPSHRPGMQHRMDTDYFDRIAALDYAISHDDGASGGVAGTRTLVERLKQADVILTGISRTSKTPTCVYLAYRGIKAANVPLLPNRDPPPELFDAMDEGVPVIGLTASPARLAHVRGQRLESLGGFGGPLPGGPQPAAIDSTPGRPSAGDYADLGRIRAEVADARLFFQRHRIPVIDVTRRSIEETAAEILAELRARGAVPAHRGEPPGPGPSADP